MAKDKGSSLFFRKLKKSPLLVNQTGAGAGVAGLLGFAGMFLIASVFFITENYFIAMFMVSVGLLIYVAGVDIVRIMSSSISIFFSSKHLIPKAVYLQETLAALQESLKIRRTSQGEIKAGPVISGSALQLPDNPLVRDMQRVIKEDKQEEYADYVSHSYYVECHELYDYSSSSLDFVANSMPLFGLIGTIIGLIAMFDGLGSDVTVESLSPQLALALKTTLYGAIFSSVYKIIGSRFEQRIKALDYDFETFNKGIQVLIENKTIIEVEE